MQYVKCNHTETCTEKCSHKQPHLFNIGCQDKCGHRPKAECVIDSEKGCDHCKTGFSGREGNRDLASQKRPKDHIELL